jgi:hypothetical protein
MAMYLTVGGAKPMGELEYVDAHTVAAKTLVAFGFSHRQYNVIGIFAYTSRRYVVRKVFDILKASG